MEFLTQKAERNWNCVYRTTNLNLKILANRNLQVFEAFYPTYFVRGQSVVPALGFQLHLQNKKKWYGGNRHIIDCWIFSPTQESRASRGKRGKLGLKADAGHISCRLLAAALAWGRSDNPGAHEDASPVTMSQKLWSCARRYRLPC
jgi:hypothetical protein